MTLDRWAHGSKPFSVTSHLTKRPSDSKALIPPRSRLPPHPMLYLKTERTPETPPEPQTVSEGTTHRPHPAGHSSATARLQRIEALCLDTNKKIRNEPILTANPNKMQPLTVEKTNPFPPSGRAPMAPAPPASASQPGELNRAIPRRLRLLQDKRPPAQPVATCQNDRTGKIT